MSDRYTNKDIKIALTDLRKGLREGTITLSFRSDPQALRKAVAYAVGLQDADAFNTENFNPQTLKRFATLFDIPKFAKTGTGQLLAWRYPSQDDTAWALQNFINRRSDPWVSFKRSEEPVEAQATATV